GKQRFLGFFDKIARPLAILLAYILLIAIMVGFSALVVPLVVDQAETLWEQRRAVFDYFSDLVDRIVAQYQLLPPEVKSQIEQTLGRFSDVIGRAVQQTLEGTAVAISYTVSLVLAIFIIPFWTFYLLKDSSKLGKSVVKSIPSQVRGDVLTIVRLIDDAFGAYLRGQLFLGLGIGVMSTIGLSILGVNFAVLLGLIAGIFELIPNIGPILGGIPAVLVAFSQDPILALWTALFALGIQQVENLFFAPCILGRSVQLHPVVVMVVLVIGSEIAGLLGLFLAPVMTAVLRDLFRYLYYRFSDDPLPPRQALKKVHQEGGFSIEV
ncbi:MAG: AI-2E family transporter, partial [Anaerolineae bacterium]